MNSPQLISVILPVFNGERHLAEAVASVRMQGYPRLEIIIVDDGSTDGSAAIAQALGDDVQYLYQENAGPAAARNRGIERATGELIAFIDADDLWPEGKLDTQLAILEERPEVDVVQGLVFVEHLGEHGLDPEVAERYAGPMFSTNLGAMLVRRRVFEQLGLFDEGLPFHEDSDFWMRAREQGINIQQHRQVMLIYRKHATNMTRGQDWNSLGLMNIMRRSITRRRSLYGSAQSLPALQADDEVDSAEHSSTSLVSVLALRRDGGESGQTWHDLIQLAARREIELLVLDLAGGAGRPEGAVIDCAGLSVGAALNRGVAQSKGAWIAIFDGNGVWSPRRLGRLKRVLSSNDELGFVMGRTQVILDPRTTYPADLLQQVHKHNLTIDRLGDLLIRRDAIERVGSFLDASSRSASIDWLLRAADLGVRHQVIASAVQVRHLSPDDPIADQHAVQQGVLSAARASLARKRGQND